MAGASFPLTKRPHSPQTLDCHVYRGVVSASGRPLESSPEPRITTPSSAAHTTHSETPIPPEHEHQEYDDGSFLSSPSGSYHAILPPARGASGVDDSDSFATRNSRAACNGIQNLLNEETNHTFTADTVRFELKVVNHPVAARACGLGDKNRRPIDPPPIVRLIVTTPSLSQHVRSRYLNFVYQMQVSLYDEDGEMEVLAFRGRNGNQRPPLVGNTFVRSHNITDEMGESTPHFIFSDLSVRGRGRFRLKFNLLMLDLASLRERGPKHINFSGFAFSNVFRAVRPVDFKGMKKSSEIARKMKDEGGANHTPIKGGHKAEELAES